MNEFKRNSKKSIISSINEFAMKQGIKLRNSYSANLRISGMKNRGRSLFDRPLFHFKGLIRIRWNIIYKIQL